MRPSLVLALLVSGARCMSSHERVATLVQDIKATREWIVSVRPVWAFMTKDEAKAAMAGEADPATLPEAVVDMSDEIMMEAETPQLLLV